MHFLISLLALAQITQAAPLTREDLFKGSKVPVKREFPLSKKVKPCEDFHKYVCGEVESRFKLPKDRSEWVFSFSDSAERLLHAKKQFFKNINNYVPPSKVEEQFKNVYLACMNEPGNAKEERRFVKEEMERLTKFKSNEEILDLSVSRMGEGEFSFSSVESIPNKENPLRNDALIGSEAQTLPERSYYENPKVVADFRAILVDFFKTVKADQPEKRADWVLAFETDFAKKTPLPREMRGRESEKRDISRKDLLAKYKNLKMDKYLEKVPANAIFVDLVNEANDFMNKAVVETPFAQLQSVYMWHSIHGIMDDAYPAFYKKLFAFNHKHFGSPGVRPPRQERCTRLASGMFKMEFDRGMMNVLFPNFPEKKVVDVAETIRASIIKGLETNTWLSSDTKKEAIKKMSTAKLFLVKPQTEDDWDFRPLRTYGVENKHENTVIFAKALTEKMFKEMAEDRNPNRWGMGPLTVNAYYSGIDNKFVLPMGILQYPFFDGEGDLIQNLGAIGAVVGHELGHGIDDQGSKYDYAGKVRQWFAEKDLKEFEKRGAAFIDQFNKIGHDGKLTLGENIGDHVGLTFAYNAAFPDAAKATEQDKRKFFEAYGRNWCMVALPAALELGKKTDPHAVTWERINQQVIHVPGFYEAFHCKAGDKMFKAEAERIKVW